MPYITQLPNQLGQITSTSRVDLWSLYGAQSDIDASNHRIMNLTTPQADHDAVTKAYVDGQPGLSQNLENVLAIGNDAGAQRMINVADPVQTQDVATKHYIDTHPGTNENLSRVLTNGNSASTAIDMSGNRIINVGAPVADTDVANRNYVATNFLPITGGRLQGTLDMSGQDIIKIASISASGITESAEFGSVSAPLLNMSARATNINIVHQNPIQPMNIHSLGDMDVRADSGDLNITGDDVNIATTGLTNVLNITGAGAVQTTAGGAINNTAGGAFAVQAGGLISMLTTGSIQIGSGNVLGATTSIEKLDINDNVVSKLSGASDLVFNNVSQVQNSGGPITLQSSTTATVQGTSATMTNGSNSVVVDGNNVRILTGTQPRLLVDGNGIVNASGSMIVGGTATCGSVTVTDTFNTPFSGNLVFNKSINGGNTNSGTELGYITFNGCANSGFRRSAMIFCGQDGDSNGNNVPGALVFHTTSSTGGTAERMRISSTGAVTIAGNMTMNGNSFNVVNDSYPGMNVKTATTSREGYFYYNTATDKLTLATMSNAYPIRLEGSQVEMGNLFSSGNLQGRAFYTFTALTGTVSQNGYGALFVPPETGAYLFSAYLTTAPSTAYIAGMMFAVNGTLVRISTQFSTFMQATGTNETSLLIQNLSSTASPIRISVQRFGL